MKAQNNANTSTTAPTATPTDFLKNLQVPTVDVESLFATQRKNLDAAVEAYRVATDGIKAIAKRQDEIVKETVGQLKGQATKVEAPEKYVELATAMARQSFDQMREISELALKANREVLDVFTKRSNDAMAELKAAVKVAKA